MDNLIKKLDRFWIECIVFIVLFALLTFGSMAYILSPSETDRSIDKNIDRIEQSVERMERIVEER